MNDDEEVAAAERRRRERGPCRDFTVAGRGMIWREQQNRAAAERATGRAAIFIKEHTEVLDMRVGIPFDRGTRRLF